MNHSYTAKVYSLFNFLSLTAAMVLWTTLAVLSVFLSVYCCYRLFAINQKTPEFPYIHLFIITLYFFLFFEGLQAGQNHWITLLSVSGLIFFMFKDQWYLAESLAGQSIYKPQFVFGCVIIAWARSAQYSIAGGTT